MTIFLRVVGGEHDSSKNLVDRPNRSWLVGKREGSIEVGFEKFQIDNF